MPPALVRSGRVELWLEMKLPDPAARTQILSDYLQLLPADLQGINVEQIIAATDGFTGADLKRTVEDAKAIYAYDKSRSIQMAPITDYFLRAVEAVRVNKSHYEQAEAQISMKPNFNMPGFMRNMSFHVWRGDEDSS